MYATYEEYRTLYAGTLFTSAEEFLPFAERASAYIDSVTFGELEDTYCTAMYSATVLRNVKKCCCALAENQYYYDERMRSDAASASKQSEGIGRYSVTYMNPLDALEKLTGGTFAAYQYDTALRYLGDSGLMYRGV